MIISALHRIRYFIIVFLLGICTFSCGFLLSSNDNAWLELENSTSSLSAGQSYSFKLVMKDDAGLRQDVTNQASWNTSSESIAEFTKSGVLFAKTAGTVALGAEYNGLNTSRVMVVSGSTYTRYPGDLYFVPDNIYVDPDNEFVTEIHMNTGTQRLASYYLNISFDPGILDYVRCETVPTGFYNLTSEAVISNTLWLSGIITGGVAPNSDLTIIKIFWKANNPGCYYNYQLNLSDLIFTDDLENPLPGPYGYSCYIGINGTPLPKQIRVTMGPTGTEMEMGHYSMYEFGDVPNDGPGYNTGPDQFIIIHNDSTSDLYINSITCTDTYNFFIDYMENYPPLTINGNSSVSVMIRFDPSDLDSINATIEIGSSDSEYPYFIVNLHGNGIIY
jgi:hypothetical protein